MKLKHTVAALGLFLLTALPGAAQTFPSSNSGRNFGIGDVISIVGGMRGGQTSPYGGGYGYQRPSKVETAIGIASVLYQMNQQRKTSQQPPYQPYPDQRSGGYYPPQQPQNYPPQQPQYYPPQQPQYYPPQQPTYSPPPQQPQYYPTTGGLVQPSGYEAIAYAGKPTRLDPSILPLTINPGSNQHARLVEDAVNTWNSAGLGQLFQVTSGQADLTVDWSGRNVSDGARAETRMIRSATRVVPTGLSVKTAGRNADQLTRVVTHELGHVLGLDHSSDRDDVMYRSEQNRPTGLTNRDRQMLHWLYSQQSYLPIVGKTDVGGAPTVASRFMDDGNSFGNGEWSSTSVCRFHSH